MLFVDTLKRTLKILHRQFCYKYVFPQDLGEFLNAETVLTPNFRFTKRSTSSDVREKLGDGFDEEYRL